MKPGSKTSEFALALLGPVVAIVVLVAQFFFNVTLNTEQLTTLGTFLIGHSVLSFGYSKSRATVKEAAIHTSANVAASVSEGISQMQAQTPSPVSGVDAAIAVMES